MLMYYTIKQKDNNMKNTQYIKKITEFKMKETKCYYFQIGTRLFSLSMPTEYTNLQVRETLKELSENLENAIPGISMHDAPYRAVVNQTEATTYAPIDFELDKEDS